MIIPVRCFTCGKVIGNKWESFLQLLKYFRSFGASFSPFFCGWLALKEKALDSVCVCVFPSNHAGRSTPRVTRWTNSA